jgi:hypothetical protein
MDFIWKENNNTLGVDILINNNNIKKKKKKTGNRNFIYCIGYIIPTQY